MKKITILSVILSAAFIALPYLSLADNNSSVTDTLNEIKQSQNVSQNQDIQCGKVTDDQFEKLGDAVEDVMHPNEQQQNLMDQMMGGEGSNSLKAAHIVMGQRYLGCVAAVGYSGMMGGYGMMGSYGTSAANGYNGYYGGMMGGNGNGYYGMMGNWGNAGWSGWVVMALFWILIIIGIVVLMKWLLGGRRAGGEERSALDILKERYAKGEINKKEFEEKKKDLV